MCESVHGIHLGLSVRQLEDVSLDRIAMFNAWINSCPDPSWPNLITALSAHILYSCRDDRAIYPTTGNALAIQNPCSVVLSEAKLEDFCGSNCVFSLLYTTKIL